MKFSQLLIFLSFALMFSKCSLKTKTKITNSKDYNNYLVNNVSNTAKNDFKITTEQLLLNNPTNVALLSSSWVLIDIKEVKAKIELENKANKFKNLNHLRALAKSSILLNNSIDALHYLNEAEGLETNSDENNLLFVDLYLSTDQLNEAETYLSKNININSFDYLIRLAIYNKKKGNLKLAVEILETSLEIALGDNNQQRLEFNYLQLADFYLELGDVQKSYQFYLKTLDKNTNNVFAKKGLAWIAFSFEKNTEEALRILNSIDQENRSPNYYLLKAEIAAYKNDTNEKDLKLNTYLALMNYTNYDELSAKEQIRYLSSKEESKRQALAIAKKEFAKRPTLQSYHMLAWAYYSNGNYLQSVKIAKNHLLGKTFDPQILLDVAKILKIEGRTNEVLELRDNLLSSIYKLGPNAEKEIRNL